MISATLTGCSSPDPARHGLALPGLRLTRFHACSIEQI